MSYHGLCRWSAAIAAGMILVGCLIEPSFAAKPDIEGKVVLANLDRYDAFIRVGSNRRTIKPRKASMLAPKRYPISLEYWSGNTKGGWRKQEIAKAGIYGFNFKQGKWTLTELKKGQTTRKVQPISRQAVSQRVASVARGRATRGRSPINASQARWSPLARAAWVAGSIYQFVRDEKDRDLMRRLLLYGKAEDIKDFEKWLDAADKVALPHKRELKEAVDSLAKLSDEEWKDVMSADDEAWKLAKEEIGDLLPDADWSNLDNDLAEISTDDFWKGEDQNLDLNDIEFTDNLDSDGDGDLDIGDLDLSENIDLGEVGVNTDSYDLGSFDDFGGMDGYDVGGSGFGGGADFGDSFGDDDLGDFGGGFDDF
jgi:hypothetical protein